MRYTMDMRDDKLTRMIPSRADRRSKRRTWGCWMLDVSPFGVSKTTENVVCISAKFVSVAYVT
jgi:hypothetical protein